jgi:lipopolysaccharide transport system permease protein
MVAMRKIASKLFRIRAHRIHQLELLHALVVRDLEARYKGSLLGNLWPIVHQIAQLLIYTYVFAVVLKVKLNLDGVPSGNLTYGLWLFAGLLPWTVFVNGIVQSASTVVSQPNLVQKVVFPLGLLPLVPILTAFVESSFGLVALIILVALSTQVLPWTLILLPFAWISQFLLIAGLGYLLSSMTVFLRDIPQSLIVIINLLFYATPIVYPVSVLPEAVRGWIFWVNPIATLVEVYRDLIIVGSIQHGLEWGVTTIISVCIFALGLWFYRRLRPGFADVI